jgi:hypothetical protein
MPDAIRGLISDRLLDKPKHSEGTSKAIFRHSKLAICLLREIGKDETTTKVYSLRSSPPNQPSSAVTDIVGSLKPHRCPP